MEALTVSYLGVAFAWLLTFALTGGLEASHSGHSPDFFGPSPVSLSHFFPLVSLDLSLTGSIGAGFPTTTFGSASLGSIYGFGSHSSCPPW
jgi:hypothetical protein